MVWSVAPGSTLETVSVGTAVAPVTLSWSLTDHTVNQYRIGINELPTSMTVVATANGIDISGTPLNIWSYISTTYLDNNDQLITFQPVDLVAEMPPPTEYKELISVVYDPTPSIVLSIGVAADWEQLDPITGLPLNPPVTGTDVATYTYTFLNDWTESKNALLTVMMKKYPDQFVTYDIGPYDKGRYF